ncbi:MAG: hypothetical protein GY749_05470 [Desulfobacteraceae bacterium]|nr:hypothetical protein [Desulfobacteraceae bacterium]
MHLPVLFHLKLQMEESVVPETNVYIQYNQFGDWYHLGITNENGNVKVPLIPPGKHNIRFADNTSLHKNSDADDITENDDFVLT